jgi:polyisoprenoid-binding protein YceI
MSTTAHGAPTLTPGTWRVEASASTAGFRAGNFRGDVEGTLRVLAGTVEVDPAGAPVRASGRMDARSVETGIARRDKDLRGKSFLYAAEHPVVTWDCDEVTASEDGWTAHGVLRVRGRETALTLRVLMLDGPADTLRVRATGGFDRRTLGIRAPRFLVGREVTVGVEAVLSR